MVTKKPKDSQKICIICCDAYNNSTRKNIRCEDCNYSACSSCWEKFILSDKSKEPEFKCINPECDIKKNVFFINENFTKKFSATIYVQHRKDILFDQIQLQMEKVNRIIKLKNDKAEIAKKKECVYHEKRCFESIRSLILGLRNLEERDYKHPCPFIGCKGKLSKFLICTNKSFHKQYNDYDDFSKFVPPDVNDRMLNLFYQMESFNSINFNTLNEFNDNYPIDQSDVQNMVNLYYYSYIIPQAYDFYINIFDPKSNQFKDNYLALDQLYEKFKQTNFNSEYILNLTNARFNIQDIFGDNLKAKIFEEIFDVDKFAQIYPIIQLCILDNQIIVVLKHMKEVNSRYHDEYNIIANEIYNIEHNNGIDKNDKIMFPCSTTNCKGFTSKDSTCAICDNETCIDCLELINTDDHECDEGILKSIKNIKNKTKQCPNCKINIDKASGCNDMYCTNCKTFFNWRTLLVINKCHNPEYEADLKRNPDVEINQTAVDIYRSLCLEIRSKILNFRTGLNKYGSKILEHFESNDIVLIMHLEYVINKMYGPLSHIRNMRNITFEKNINDMNKLQQKFIKDQITEQNLKTQIYKIELKNIRANIEVSTMNLFFAENDRLLIELNDYINEERSAFANIKSVKKYNQFLNKNKTISLENKATYKKLLIEHSKKQLTIFHEYYKSFEDLITNTNSNLSELYKNIGPEKNEDYTIQIQFDNLNKASENRIIDWLLSPNRLENISNCFISPFGNFLN